MKDAVSLMNVRTKQPFTSLIQGRLADALPIYRRALEVNDQLPEALCGLVHAAWSVCDWRGFGYIEEGVCLDELGNIVREDIEREMRVGWMPRMLEATEKQLESIYEINIGVIKTVGQLQDWLSWIESSIGIEISSDAREHWRKLLRGIFDGLDSEQRKNINEGGTIIRMVEWLMRHLQWRWYIELYGQIIYSQESIQPLVDVSQWKDRFVRPRLPSSLAAMRVTSVLPFHTVC